MVLKSVFAMMAGLALAGAAAAQDPAQAPATPAPVEAAPAESTPATPTPVEAAPAESTPATPQPAPAAPASVAPAPAAPSPATPASTAIATAVPPLDPENTLHLDLSTGGRVTIQLRPDAAPGHVERIKTLARQGFYNGIVFHRVIEGFMAQTGDPTGTGEGGSPLPDLTAEFNALPHVRGAVSAARTAEPNSANSQFFIMFSPRLAIDGKYSVFGRVVGGMNYVDAIERGEPPLAPSRIVRASVGSDNVPPLTPAQLAAAAAPAPAPAAPTFSLPATPPSTPPATPPAETPPADTPQP